MEVEEENGQRVFLRRVLQQGAEKLGATVSSEAVFGWRDRTIGAAAMKEGEKVWIRATGEHERWASGSQWIGNQEAVALQGVAKPNVLDRTEWDEDRFFIYVELMTFIPERPCSPTPELRSPITLTSSWWEELRRSLDALAAHDTERDGGGQESITHRVRLYFGDTIDPTISTWTTAHNDLHWNNITDTTPYILDWEQWSPAPLGYDAAFLYCHSLLVPDIARKVRTRFSDLLDGHDGQVSQLAVIGRLLERIDGGDYPELTIPLHHAADSILGKRQKI